MPIRKMGLKCQTKASPGSLAAPRQRLHHNLYIVKDAVPRTHCRTSPTWRQTTWSPSGLDLWYDHISSLSLSLLVDQFRI